MGAIPPSTTSQVLLTTRLITSCKMGTLLQDAPSRFVVLCLSLPAWIYLTQLLMPALRLLPLSLLGCCAFSYIYILLRVLITAFWSPIRVLPLAPEGALVFGHAFKLLERPSVEHLLRWMKLTPNEGMLRLSGICHMTNGILVTSPAIAHEILSTKANAFEKPSRVRNWLWILMGSGGLIIAEGHDHTVQRKALTGIFTNTSTRKLITLFWTKACCLTDAIHRGLENSQSTHESVSAEPLEGEVDLAGPSAGITLDIISVAIFGHDLNCVSNADEPMHRAWSFLANPDASQGVLSKYFVACALLPKRLADSMYGKFVKTFEEHRHSLRELCKTIVARRREEKDGTKRNDILSLILRGKSDLQGAHDERYVDQMMTMLAAGHDTTSGTFLWAIWLLAAHKDIQTKAREHIKHKLSSHRNSANFDGQDLDDLPYITAVAQEVMRLFPTVAQTVRECQRPVIVGDVQIPKGTRLYISPWALQRMPNVWSDPDSFKPERWLDERGQFNGSGGAHSSHAFLTFLEGPRSCLGQHFARSELRCLLVAMLRRFVISSASGHDGKLRMTGIITIQPKDGLKVHLKEIED